MLAKLNAIDMDKLSAQVSDLFTELRTNLASGDIHNALVRATTLLRNTDEALRAADLPGMTADIRHSSEALRDTVQGQQMQKLLANAGMAADQFATAAARLPALIASVQATAQRAGNGTADVEQGLIPLLRDMQATAQNLRQMTDELRRYPAQVFAQPPPRASEPVR